MNETFPTFGSDLASPVGPGAILGLIRSGQANTRRRITAITGLSRSTVSQRLDELVGAGLIIPASSTSGGRGRPAEAYAVNPGSGLMLVAHVGATRIDVARADMVGALFDHTSFFLPVVEGPDRVLGAIQRCFRTVVDAHGLDAADVRGVSIGLPGPIEHAIGRLVQPPIMPGWDDVIVPRWFSGEFGERLLVDNETNLMALGEHRMIWPQIQDMMFVEASTGIGAGLIMSRQLQRGAQGAAGDIGHGSMADFLAGDPPSCRCGSRGCLEAYASGWKLSEQLSAMGYLIEKPSDIAYLARSGVEAAVTALAEAGETIGIAVAHAINLLNPSLIVVGGDLAQQQEHLVATLKETVYRRAVPLATRDLRIVHSQLGAQAGLYGGAHLLLDAVFAPNAIDNVLGFGNGKLLINQADRDLDRSSPEQEAMGTLNN